jgi:phosphoribosylaminoimidazole-succinocarboxamide synthase
LDVALLQQGLLQTVATSHWPHGRKRVGKVRDIYDEGETLVLVATDRLSAFDRAITTIPYKGQVLNQLSAWWFAQTHAICNNHVVKVLAANAMRVQKCTLIPVEFVVRAYITGSTNTSLWHHYEQGARVYCGHRFADGLHKNQRLAQPILTPTSKDAIHDEPMSAQAIIARGWLSAKEWAQAEACVLALFAFGAKLAQERGLILVDSKYELGRDAQGGLVLIDELHTPDSSRFWEADGYEAAFASGQAPKAYDKEYVRLWFRDHCNPYQDKVLPEAPDALRITAAQRYIELYERLTQQAFVPSARV